MSNAEGDVNMNIPWKFLVVLAAIIVLRPVFNVLLPKNGRRFLQLIVAISIIALLFALLASGFINGMRMRSYSKQEIAQNKILYDNYYDVVKRNIQGTYPVDEVNSYAYDRDHDEKLYDYVAFDDKGRYEYIGYYYHYQTDSWLEEPSIVTIRQEGTYKIVQEELTDEEYLHGEWSNLAIVFTPEETSDDLEQAIGNKPFLTDAEISLDYKSLCLSGTPPEEQVEAFDILGGTYIKEAELPEAEMKLITKE